MWVRTQDDELVNLGNIEYVRAEFEEETGLFELRAYAFGWEPEDDDEEYYPLTYIAPMRGNDIKPLFNGFLILPRPGWIRRTAQAPRRHPGPSRPSASSNPPRSTSSSSATKPALASTN